MLEIGNIAGLIPIAIICWLVGYGVKNLSPIDNKVIPVIVGVLGLILGVVGHFIGVLGLESMDIYTAGATGIVSGGMAVYVHQLFTQFANKNKASTTDNV